MCLCCLLLSSFALYLDYSPSSDELLLMPMHQRQSLLSLFGRERRPNQPNRASLLSLVKLLAKNNLSSTGGTKEIVGVFRLNEAMKNDTVGGRNAYSPKSSEALSWSATSRAHLGNSIPGEILDVRRVFIPRGTNDLRRDAGRIPEVYYLKELFLFRDIYINSLVCACSVEGSFRGWFRAAHGRVMMIGLLAYCIH